MRGRSVEDVVEVGRGDSKLELWRCLADDKFAGMGSLLQVSEQDLRVPRSSAREGGKDLIVISR